MEATKNETPNDVWKLGATEQLALVTTGELSCAELVSAHLGRIANVNPTINAVTTVLADGARAAARLADSKPNAGPLRGLPFTVKSDIDCFGSPTSRGVPALRNALPYTDSPVVARLKAAGAIPIARTNLSEMGLRLCTDNPLHGRTLNPYNRSLTVGGSSGGDAAAVATGMTPLGIGGDLGGSLRVPAACCGCVTLKPTSGRIPHASSLPPRDHSLVTQLMFSVGPIVRSVADLQLLLPVLAGRDIRDPRSVDAPLVGPPPTERTAAIVTSLPGSPVPDSAVAATVRAAQVLQAAGWNVEEATPPDLQRVLDVFASLLAGEARVLQRQLEPFISDSLFQHLQRLADIDTDVQLSDFTLHTERARLIREWSQFFSAYPVLIGPNLATPIWSVDADLNPTTGIQLIADATRFIAPANALGFPSLALPMGRADGLPTSVLIQADLWREHLCLDVAGLIEAHLPVEQDRWDFEHHPAMMIGQTVNHDRAPACTRPN